MERYLLALRTVVFLQQMAVTAGSRGVNITLHKTARQSSFYLDNPKLYGPEKGVDGGLNTTCEANTCTHTSNAKYWPWFSRAWWEVDLGSHYIIGNIRMLNRAGVYMERLHDMRINVFENKDRPRKMKHCITHEGPAGPGWLNLYCESPVTGRFVRITKPKKDKKDVLTLCEVEIYEENPSDRERIPGQCMLLNASGEDETLVGWSLLHCASVCGATTGCKGLRATGKRERRTWWKRRQVSMEFDIISISYR